MTPPYSSPPASPREPPIPLTEITIPPPVAPPPSQPPPPIPEGETPYDFVAIRKQIHHEQRRANSSHSATNGSVPSSPSTSQARPKSSSLKQRGSTHLETKHVTFPLPPGTNTNPRPSRVSSSSSRRSETRDSTRSAPVAERKEKTQTSPLFITVDPIGEENNHRDSWKSDSHADYDDYDGGDDSSYRQLTSVANVDFEDAMLSQKPRPWTRTMFKLYFFLLVACLNSTINGYDGSIMAGINAMESYQGYFNMSTVGTKTGIVFSSYTIGNIIGSFFCGPFTDRWGRRWGMFIGAAIIILGTLVQAPAHNTAMFIGGRFILGFGVATCATAGPSYVAEMAHPAWRGTLTGLYNVFWFVGGIPASWTVFATRNLPNNLSWRLPIWLQCGPAGLVLCFSLFCPETPRWLISNDRHAEALHVLATYHGEGNPRSPLVLLTIREMLEEIATEGSDKRWWDYRSLFNTRAALWRMMCVSGMAFLSQWCGNGAVSYFLPALLDIIGVTDEATQLQYNGFLNVIQFVMATLGAKFTDRLGRRPVLMWGSALLIFWWLGITTLTGIYQHQIIQCHRLPSEPVKVLSALAQKVCAHRDTPEYKTPPWSAAIIALIYLFGITYSFTYTPLQALYPVECLGYEERAKGMGFYNLMTNIAMFFNTFAVPTVLEKIGWKLFFLYVAFNAVAIGFIYLFFVETKGRTLEEINDIFEDPYPRKRSLQKHLVVVTHDGVVLNKLGSG